MQNPKNLTFKYLVIGDSGVGKTSLLMRYCQDAFQTEYLSTIGVDFKMKRIQVGDNNVTLNIWDTAGQERFRNITKSFYKGAHGIVLTYSILDQNSFKHIETWVDQIKQSNNVQCQMILIAMKADLQENRHVLKKSGEALAQKYGISFFEASAKTNQNVNQIFYTLTQKILSSALANQLGNTEPIKKIKKQKIKTKEKCC